MLLLMSLLVTQSLGKLGGTCEGARGGRRVQLLIGLQSLGKAWEATPGERKGARETGGRRGQRQ